MRTVVLFFAAFAALTLRAHTVSLGNVVCNAGAKVAVPLLLDEAKGLASVEIVVTYDPLVLVPAGVRPGPLSARFDFDFDYLEASGQTTVVCAARDDIVEVGGGVLAVLDFEVRENSAGLYSDLALADVRLNERTMTLDFRADTKPKSGLLRPFMKTGVCDLRVGEGAVVVAPGTTLSKLVLAEGDALQASNTAEAISVTDVVEAKAPIQVLPPDGGWTKDRYELISVPGTAELVFEVLSAPEQATLECVEAAGRRTYVLETGAVASVEAGDDGVQLSDEDIVAIRALFEGKLDGVQRIIASGRDEAIRLGIALGLRPKFEIEGGDLKATFESPSLSVMEAAFVGQPSEGVFHIKGGSTLRALMEYPTELEVKELDASSYQLDGMLTLKVQLSESTFFLRVVLSPGARTP